MLCLNMASAGHQFVDQGADQRTRHVTAPMRRADVHLSRHEGQGFQEQQAANQRALGLGEIRFLRGLSLSARQRWSPCPVAVSLVNTPPWLWPITTICRRAASFPAGSSFCTVAVSSARSSEAESITGQADAAIQKQPDLTALAQNRVGIQGGDHFRPPNRTGESPCTKTTGTPPGPARLGHEHLTPQPQFRGKELQPLQPPDEDWFRMAALGAVMSVSSGAGRPTVIWVWLKG